MYDQKISQRYQHPVLKEIKMNTKPFFNKKGKNKKLTEWVECSLMAQDTGVQSQVESYQRLRKRLLMPPCLTFSILRYKSNSK